MTMDVKVSVTMPVTDALRLMAWLRRETLDTVKVPELDGVKYHEAVAVDLVWTCTVGPRVTVRPERLNVPPREDWAVSDTDQGALVIRAPKMAVRLSRDDLGFIKLTVE